MVVGDIPSGTDVAVIGGGPGGYVAAIRAGQLGLDVTLIERDAYGGTCLNHGCIPSKALTSATELHRRATSAADMGIRGHLEIDVETLLGWKDDVVDQLTGSVERLCEAAGVTLVDGTAAFVDDRTLRITGPAGQMSETITFERAVVATGSRPVEIPGFSFDDPQVLSSREALSLEAPPDRLVVVGAGYIGLELSAVFARLGTDVTVVEALPDVLPGYDADVTRIVKRRAEENGIRFAFEQAVTDWRTTADGIVVLTEPENGDRSQHPADRVLVAVGRRPVTDALGLDEIGLETTDRGFVETDDQTRTAVDHVFAVGDVAGGPLLAHKAMKEGRVAAEMLAGEPAGIDYQVIPAVVFTEPEVATVGLTRTDAVDAGYAPIVGQYPFSANGRAATAGESDGFVRVIADRETELLLGGQIVGPEASELIAQFALAIEMGATLEDVAGTVYAHPTLGEAVLEAAENALGRAIHVRN